MSPGSVGGEGFDAGVSFDGEGGGGVGVAGVEVFREDDLTLAGAGKGGTVGGGLEDAESAIRDAWLHGVADGADDEMPRRKASRSFDGEPAGAFDFFAVPEESAGGFHGVEGEVGGETEGGGDIGAERRTENAVEQARDVGPGEDLNAGVLAFAWTGDVQYADIVFVKPVGCAGEIGEGDYERRDTRRLAVAGGKCDRFLGAGREIARLWDKDEGGVGVEDVSFGSPWVIGAWGFLHGGIVGGDSAIFGPAAFRNPSADGKTTVESGVEGAAVNACLGSGNDFFEHGCEMNGSIVRGYPIA